MASAISEKQKIVYELFDKSHQSAGTSNHISTKAVIATVLSAVPDMDEAIMLLAKGLDREFAAIPQSTKEKMLKERLRVCSSCGDKDVFEKMMRCTRCKTAIYCDVDCQRADWKKHKKVCVAPKNEQKK